MTEIIGTHNRIIEIDLNNSKIEFVNIKEEDRKLYLGGRGLGLKLLAERLKPGTDPLSKENVIVINTGVYMSSNVPCSARFSAVTKSPLTGIIINSSCGGPFGMALKTAGYDGLILKGKCDKPSFILIDDKVEVRDASHLWGKNTEETQAELNKIKNAGSMVIGPAGENKVLYANVVSGHRYLGRGGIGAVLGSKNIKAVVAIGKKFKYISPEIDRHKKIKKLATDYINRNRITSIKYRKFGTNSHINLCNDGNILPVRNFTGGSHAEAHKVSGELYAEKYTTGYSTCKPCTILCGHKGDFNGKKMQIPEYETTGVFGPNLEVFDPVAIAEWSDLCGKLGIDTISMGNVIGWSMEATEKGLIKTKLKFGSTENISQLIEDVAYRKNIGDDLADGVRKLSNKFGGEDFAIHVKGLEIAAYDPRGSWGQGLSYAVANKGGSHLSAVLFAPEVTLGIINPLKTKSKAFLTDFFENMFAAVNAMHGCQFTGYAYFLEPFLAKVLPDKLLGLFLLYLPRITTKFVDISIYNKSYQAITGLKLSQKKMLKAGKRIHILERYLNTLEGIGKKDDTLPERFLKEGRENDPKKLTVPLDKMLGKYYRIKGYDKNGIPKKSVMKKLKIQIPLS